MLCEVGLKVLEDNASLSGHYVRGVIEVENAVHFREVEDKLILNGYLSANESGVAALRDDGDLVSVAEGEELAKVLSRGWKDDDF